MKLPLSWLQYYFPHPLTTDEICNLLLSRGIEVDAVEVLNPPFTGIVVGLVESVEKHPKADRLVVAQVFDGKERFQVVCGAPNCRAGIKVPFAKIGARIWTASNTSQTDTSSELVIRQAALRGVDSFGMLCAADELGLGAYEKQILELDDVFMPGEDFAAFCTDTIFELSLTPDLGHCLSVYGIARELSIATGHPLNPTLTLPPFLQATASSKGLLSGGSLDVLANGPTWTIKNSAPEACDRYGLLAIEGIKNGPSPFWLQQLLLRAGYRPKNLVVDCANFIMASIGQPLHTFDKEAWKTTDIDISLVKSPVEVALLDGTVVKIPSNLLVIKNQDSIEAVAGLMGSKASAVTPETTSLLIESAHFAPWAVRRAKTALNISSESSRRFERGTDIQLVPKALSLFLALLQTTSKTAIQATAFIDQLFRPIQKRTVSIALKKAACILGREITCPDLEWVLNRLGYPFIWSSTSICTVEIPPHRNDIQSDIDLIDELWKILPADTTPYQAKFTPTQHPSHPFFLLEKEVRQTAVSLGLQEWLCCSLISPKAAACCVKRGVVEPGSLIMVQNPMSQEQSVLRPSLFPGMVESYVRNYNVKNPGSYAFEIGILHLKSEQGYIERLTLGMLLAGEKSPYAFDRDPHLVDFFDLKGLVEQFCKEWSLPLRFEKSTSSLFHPGQQANIFCNSVCIGALGALHPAVVKEFQGEGDLFFAQIDVQDLLEQIPDKKPFVPLPQYPGMERDWTVTIDESVPYETLVQKIKELASSDCVGFRLQSIFRSEKIGKGKKNICMKFFYRNDQRTLVQEEVDAQFFSLTQKISQTLTSSV